MNAERREPVYQLTEKQVADKSEIARRFLDTRTRLNANVDKADNFLVKRFYDPPELERDLGARGFSARVTTTEWAFMMGRLTRR